MQVYECYFLLFDIYVLHNLVRCYKIYRLVRGILHRGVAQVVECLLREQEAVGSSPATPTNFFPLHKRDHRGVAQVARVLA